MLLSEFRPVRWAQIAPLLYSHFVQGDTDTPRKEGTCPSFQGLEAATRAQCSVVGLEVMVVKSESISCSVMSDSLSMSSVHGILWARILEWVAIPFSRGSSRPRDGTRVSCISGNSLLSEPPRKP